MGAPRLSRGRRRGAGSGAVQHRRARKVWQTGPSAVAAIAGLFDAAPHVQVNEVPASGHNLSVGLTAGQYHGQVLSFIEECIAGTQGRDRVHVEAS